MTMSALSRLGQRVLIVVVIGRTGDLRVSSTEYES